MKRFTCLAAALGLILAVGLATSTAKAQLASERAGAFYFGESEPGDGFIGSSDLSAIVAQMKSTSGSYLECEPPHFSIQDVDGDGFIGAGDKSVISQWIKNIWPAISGRAGVLAIDDGTGTPSSTDVSLTVTAGDSLNLAALAYDANFGNLRAGWGVLFTASSVVPGCSPLLQGHNPFSGLTTRPDIITAAQVHGYTYRPDAIDNGWTQGVKLISYAGCSDGDTIHVAVTIPDDVTANVSGSRMPTTLVGPSFVITVGGGTPVLTGITYSLPTSLVEGATDTVEAICSYSDLSTDDCTAAGGFTCGPATGDVSLAGCVVTAAEILGPNGGSGSVTVTAGAFSDVGAIVVANNDTLVSTLITGAPASVLEGGAVTFTVVETWSDGFTADVTAGSLCSGGCSGGDGSCVAAQELGGAAPPACVITDAADNSPVSVTVVNDDTITSTLITGLPATASEGALLPFAVTRTWSDSFTEDLTAGSTCSGGCSGSDGLCTAAQEPGGAAPAACVVADTDADNTPQSVTILNDDTITSTLITGLPASAAEGAVVPFTVTRTWSDSFTEDLTAGSTCSGGCSGGNGSCTMNQEPCGAAPAACVVEDTDADNTPQSVTVTNDDTISSTLIAGVPASAIEGANIIFTVNRIWSDSCIEDMKAGSTCSGGCSGTDGSGICTMDQAPGGAAPADCVVTDSDATNSPQTATGVNDDTVTAVDILPNAISLVADGDTVPVSCTTTWSDLFTESCLASVVDPVGCGSLSGGLYTAAGAPCEEDLTVTVSAQSDTTHVVVGCIAGTHDYYAVAAVDANEGDTVSYVINDIDTCGNATVVAGETASPSGDCANVGGSIPGNTVTIVGTFGFDANLEGWSATGAPTANIPAWAATPLGSFGSAAIRFPGTADATNPAANTAAEAIAYTANATDRTSLHFTGTVCTCATDINGNEYLDVQYNCGSGLQTLGSFAAGNNTSNCDCSATGAQRSTFDYTLPAACEGNSSVILQVSVRNGADFAANERNYVDNLLLTGVTPSQPGNVEIVANEIPCGAGGSCTLSAAPIGGETVLSDTIAVINDDTISSTLIGGVAANYTEGDLFTFAVTRTWSDSCTEDLTLGSTCSGGCTGADGSCTVSQEPCGAAPPNCVITDSDATNSPYPIIIINDDTILSTLISAVPNPVGEGLPFSYAVDRTWSDTCVEDMSAGSGVTGDAVCVGLNCTANQIPGGNGGSAIITDSDATNSPYTVTITNDDTIVSTLISGLPASSTEGAVVTFAVNRIWSDTYVEDLVAGSVCSGGCSGGNGSCTMNQEPCTAAPADCVVTDADATNSPQSFSVANDDTISSVNVSPDGPLTLNNGDTVPFSCVATCSDTNTENCDTALGDLPGCGSLTGTLYTAANGACSDTVSATWGGQSDSTSISVNAPATCTLSIVCTSPQPELSQFSCAVTYDDAGCTGTLALDASNTCAAASVTDNGNGTGTYYSTPTEAQGPGTCVAGVQLAADSKTASQTVTISEVNSAPSVTVTCPASVNEDTGTTCTTAATDPDVPANTLTLSIDPSSTCTGLSIAAGIVTVPAQGEAAGPGSCSVVVQVADNGTPVLSSTGSDSISILEVNQTPSVTVNCPASVAENTGTTCTTAASDPDVPANTLTLSIHASSTCTGLSIAAGVVTVPAQGEAAGPGSCTVVVQVADNGTPVLSSTGSDTISITEVNLAPTGVLTCPASLAEDTAGSCNATKTDPDLPAQTVTCSLGAGTCTGETLSGCTVTVPAQGEQTQPYSCSIIVNLSDGASTTVRTSNISITEVNVAPVITNLPYSTLTSESSYDVNYTDADLAAQTITFSINSETCSFTPSIVGSTGVVSWTCGGVETCSVVVRATDNGSPALYDQETLTVNCAPPPSVPIISYVWPLRATTDDRFRLNAHPDQHLTVVMDPAGGVPTSVTVACGAVTFSPCTNADADQDWDCAPTGTFTSYYATTGGGTEYTCTVNATNGSGTDTTPATAIAALRAGLSTISAKGGIGGGYVGSNIYNDNTGSGTGAPENGTVSLTVVNEDDRASIGGKAYVQVIQSGVTRQFFTNASGVVSMTLPPEDIDELTIGYKCGLTDCDSTIHINGARPNRAGYYNFYQYKTFIGLDAQNLILPIPLFETAWFGRNKAVIGGTLTSTAFVNYIGQRPNSPNPRARKLLEPPVRLRVGLVVSAFRDTSAIAGGLDALLLTPDYDISIAVCLDNNPTPKITQILKTALPVNLVAPELIRWNWTLPCNTFDTNPSYTRYEMWSWTPGEWKVIWALGAYANASNFSLVGGIDLFGFPIYGCALGAHGMTIPTTLRTGPINTSINLNANFEQDIRENWTNDPLGYDFDTAVDRKYFLHVMPTLPFDPARQTSRLYPGFTYRLPNLSDSELGANWDTRFYRKALILASGGDFGPKIGMGITGLALNAKIDDAQFTIFMVGYFQSTGSKMGNRNLRYWSGSTGDTEVSSVQQASGTNTWTNLTWGSTSLDWDPVDTGGPTNYAAIIALSRGMFTESCYSDLATNPSSGPALSLTFNPGSLVTVWHIGDPGVGGNETIAMTDALNMPSPVSPTTDSYIYPAPQWSNTIGASQPIGRNGEMWPDRSVTATNSLQQSGGRYYVEFTRTGMFRNTSRTTPHLWSTGLAEPGVATVDGASISGWRGRASGESNIYSTQGYATGTAGVFQNVVDITAFVTAAKVPYRQSRWLSQVRPGDTLVIMSRKTFTGGARCNARLYICQVNSDNQVTVSESSACATMVNWTTLACNEGTRNIQGVAHIRYRIVRAKVHGEQVFDEWEGRTNTFWSADGPGEGTGNIRAYVPVVTPGSTTLNGVTGYIPSLWESAPAGLQLQWNFSATVFNTSAATSGGMGRAFNYNNREDLLAEDRQQQFTSSDNRFVRYQ